MSIQAPETEHRLAEAARRQGISVDALLDRLLVEEAADTVPAPDPIALPTWNLGAMGSLHRRDIYDDVP
jgi:hypothetical protein